MSRESPRLQALAVVVPAHDERELLGGCLEALAASAEHVALPVVTVVCLDRCSDGTASVLPGRSVAGRAVHGVTLDAGSVGVARAAGVDAALAQLGHLDPERIWVLNTDADSRVDDRTLAEHCRLADAGADLVLGTVRLHLDLTDGTGVPDGGAATGGFDSRSSDGAPHLVQAWAAGYDASDGHSHVHGAHLGVRASTYRAAGGFRRLRHDEDVELAQAVDALPGSVVVRTAAAPVTTSARLVARAPLGFAHHLRELRARAS